MRDFNALAERAFRKAESQLPQPLPQRDVLLAMFKSGYFDGVKEGALAMIESLKESAEQALLTLTEIELGSSGKPN